jgi:hypothetical protein
MAIFIIERVDERAGAKSLAPLVIAGALSILYWRQVISSVQIFFFSVPFCFQSLHFHCLYCMQLLWRSTPVCSSSVCSVHCYTCNGYSNSADVYTFKLLVVGSRFVRLLLNVNLIYVLLDIIFKKKVRTLYVGGANHGICNVVNSSIALRQSGSQQGCYIFLPPWSCIWE